MLGERANLSRQLKIHSDRVRAPDGCELVAMAGAVDAASEDGLWQSYVRAGYPQRAPGRRGYRKDDVIAWAGRQ